VNFQIKNIWPQNIQNFLFLEYLATLGHSKGQFFFLFVFISRSMPRLCALLSLSLFFTFTVTLSVEAISAPSATNYQYFCTGNCDTNVQGATKPGILSFSFLSFSLYFSSDI